MKQLGIDWNVDVVKGLGVDNFKKFIKALTKNGKLEPQSDENIETVYFNITGETKKVKTIKKQ